MKKSFRKLDFKKSKVSNLTAAFVKGGALPTTKQSTVNKPPESLICGLD